MTFPTHAPARSSRATKTRSLGLALALGGALGGAVVMAPVREALAGTAQFQDPSSMLDEPSRARVRAAASSLPFDVRVLVDNTPDVASLTQRAQASLSAPDQLVIALDPANRRTVVRAGMGLRIPTQRMSMLADAGNPFFRVGDYAGGVNAIAQYTGASLGAAGGAVSTRPFSRTSTGVPARSSGPPVGVFVILGVAALVIGGLALARRRSPPGFTGGGPGTPNYRSPATPGPFGGPAYGGPQQYGQGYGGGYGPGYGAPAAGSGIGTAIGAGVAGAALGGLAGYAIGSRGEQGTTGSNNDTVGGGGGDFGGGGGDAASWDGGGGGDFGGGGGDAGGWD